MTNYIPRRIRTTFGEISKRQVVRKWRGNMPMVTCRNAEIMDSRASKSTINTEVKLTRITNELVLDPDSPLVVDTPNKSFNLRLISYDLDNSRYSVVTSDGILTHISDESYSKLISVGCLGQGGEITGKWTWAVGAGLSKPIREKTALHRYLVQTSPYLTMKRIPNKSLKVGSVYVTQTGEYRAFLGHVSTSCSYSRHQLWWVPKGTPRQTDLQTHIDTSFNSKDVHSFEISKTGCVAKKRDLVLGPKVVQQVQKVFESYFKERVRDFENQLDSHSKLTDTPPKWDFMGLEKKLYVPPKPSIVPFCQGFGLAHIHEYRKKHSLSKPALELRERVESLCDVGVDTSFIGSLDFS